MKKIVLIEDERTVQVTLGNILQRHHYEVVIAPNAKQGLAKIAEIQPDLVLLDLQLPDADGLDVLKQIKAEFPQIEVIILTAHDSLSNAIDSIKLGAFHFVPKPYSVEELLGLCQRAVAQRELQIEAENLRREKAALQKKLKAAEEQLAPLAISRKMREISHIIARVAPTDANVLLTGESGVGKEVVARAIHVQSARSGANMVKLNCAAFPANMIEAELFGYAKGAFTGAVAAFPGMLAEADGGTLFLDEITEMPVELQTRFLRVLQEREFRSLGSTETKKVDFRLIAACNRRPDEAVREGRLRQDLYFRLKTFEIEIPPLRERREDIPKLTEIFLSAFSKNLGKPVPQISKETLELLRAYPWPGNVRELQNAIEHALVLCDGPVLEPRFLPREVQMPDLAKVHQTAAPDAPASLEQIERDALIDALRRTNGNKKRAAELLGIQRPTLYAKMKRLGVAV